MSICKIWTKCDLDDYEAGSFAKNDLGNSNNYRCGKNYINTEPQTKLRTNFILMTINFNYKYRSHFKQISKCNKWYFSDTFVNNTTQILDEMRNESQYRVFPALVLITATHLLYIEWLINAIEIRA